jgi:hypothetical protein
MELIVIVCNAHVCPKLVTKSGPPGNMNVFKHGLAAVQKRREEGVATEHEENVRQLDGFDDDWIERRLRAISKMPMKMPIESATVSFAERIK